MGHKSWPRFTGATSAAADKDQATCTRRAPGVHQVCTTCNALAGDTKELCVDTMEVCLCHSRPLGNRDIGKADSSTCPTRPMSSCGGGRQMAHHNDTSPAAKQ